MTPRIQIHPPAEEEIVIEAGLPPQDTPSDGVGSATAEVGTAPAAEAEAAGPEDTPEPESAADTPAPVAPKAPAAKAADEFAETTLEDLKGTPMGVTQRVVLICVAVGLVVFVVWYLLSYVFI